MKALLVPEYGPVQEVELNGTLEQLQALVGGNIEALPLPDAFDRDHGATAYVNDEGKFSAHCKVNMRATDFMLPGVGLFPGDYIAGPFLLCGFDARTGEHAELPERVAARMRLIEREAS